MPRAWIRPTQGDIHTRQPHPPNPPSFVDQRAAIAREEADELRRRGDEEVARLLGELAEARTANERLTADAGGQADLKAHLDQTLLKVCVLWDG